MSFDIGKLQPILEKAPYPVGKSDLVQFVQQHADNPQVVNLVEKLPDKKFNSAQDVENSLGGPGNIL